MESWQGPAAARTPLISVVVPARDEERCIGATLEALRRQTWPGAEILVVANGCRDRTAEIAERYGRVIRLGEAGASQALNHGARAARGEVLVFLDADVLLPPAALELLARRFTPRCAVGTFAARPSGDRLWYRALFALRNALHRSGLYRSTMGVIVCRRESFLQAGGVDPARQPRQNRDLVRRLLRFGRYRFLNLAVTVSTRRYEQWGGWRMARFWVPTYLRSLAGRYGTGGYDAVR
jgi:glycosyltransferase involved in cell wall biosynthesis